MLYIELEEGVAKLQTQLESLNWLSGEIIQKIEKPGEGNMNVVIRVITDQRSFILKQSRPFVQKYQDIAAPLDRIHVEYLFYKSLEKSKIKNNLPKLLKYSQEEHLLMLEDLGDIQDFTSIYESRKVDPSSLEQLVFILQQIHETPVESNYPANLELRQLNYQHIFVLPYAEDNGFDLNDIQPGLQDLALSYKRDVELKETINRLGELYLSSGSYLLHGDYYPGSWMSNSDQVYVLDPEFSFMGFREFDLGVMAGHIIMATGDLDYLTSITELYSSTIDHSLIQKIAGIEIMRRLIGLAQLPLERSITEKEDLLNIAHQLILE